MKQLMAKRLTPVVTRKRGSTFFIKMGTNGMMTNCGNPTHIIV